MNKRFPLKFTPRVVSYVSVLELNYVMRSLSSTFFRYFCSANRCVLIPTQIMTVNPRLEIDNQKKESNALK